jgi:hypothetical protein
MWKRRIQRRKKPAASILRRSREQKDPGSKKVSFAQKGDPQQIAISDVALPSGLFASMTDEQQLWFRKWHRGLKDGETNKTLNKMEKPLAAENSSEATSHHVQGSY